MLDKQILAAAIQDRSAYERVAKHVSPKEFSPQAAFWWKLLSEYYTRDSAARSADRDTLLSIGESRITNPKHREGIVAALGEHDSSISSSNVVSAVLGLKRYNASAEFASAAMGGDADKAQKLLGVVNELWQRDNLDQEERIYAASIDDIFSVVGAERRIKVSPAALNERIGGGVLPGHHILVFGRTEVGKTAFTINLASGFIKRGLKVLYVGNEDEINVTKGRFICRLTRRTWNEVEADKRVTSKLFVEAGGEDRLRCVHLQPGSVESTRRDIDEFEPAVIVVDQLRNMSGPEEGMTQRMEGNAIRFRNLISEYGLVGVSVTQAGNRDQRHNEDSPVWLSSGDVDSSRVGLPAQVDLMLGIGGNAEMLSRGQRAISLVKNKLASSSLSREGFIVQADLGRCIFK
jgi:hypothetical protein